MKCQAPVFFFFSFFLRKEITGVAGEPALKMTSFQISAVRYPHFHFSHCGLARLVIIRTNGGFLRPTSIGIFGDLKIRFIPIYK